MDYLESFNKRGNEYKYAIDNYIYIIENEFKEINNLINFENEITIVNIAGGVPINLYFPSEIKINYIPLEINEKLSQIYNYPLVKNNNLELLSESVGYITLITFLHHYTENERIELYNECKRVLKPGGKLIIADVIKESKQDKFLNEFVNHYNSNGHNGIFFNESDKKDLFMFNYTEFQTKKYYWISNNMNELCDFFKNLFGLDLASNADIINGINNYLDYTIINDKIYIEWELCYLISVK